MHPIYYTIDIKLYIYILQQQKRKLHLLTNGPRAHGETKDAQYETRHRGANRRIGISLNIYNLDYILCIRMVIELF